VTFVISVKQHRVLRNKLKDSTNNSCTDARLSHGSQSDTASSLCNILLNYMTAFGINFFKFLPLTRLSFTKQYTFPSSNSAGGMEF